MCVGGVFLTIRLGRVMPLRWESRTNTHNPDEVAICNKATGLLEPFTCTHSQSSPTAPSLIASLQSDDA